MERRKSLHFSLTLMAKRINRLMVLRDLENPKDNTAFQRQRMTLLGIMISTLDGLSDDQLREHFGEYGLHVVRQYQHEVTVKVF